MQQQKSTRSSCTVKKSATLWVISAPMNTFSSSEGEGGRRPDEEDIKSHITNSPIPSSSTDYAP